MNFDEVFIIIYISQGKSPYGDVNDNEAKQRVLNGTRPIKPLKCSGEL